MPAAPKPPDRRGSGSAPGAERDRIADRGRAISAMELRPQHLYRAAALLFGLALLFRFFAEITQTLLLIYACAILAVALNPLARALPLERRLLAALVGIVAIAGLGLLAWFGIPPLLGQLRLLAERAPAFQAQLESWADWIRDTTGLNVALLSEQTATMIRTMFQSFGTEEIFGRARGALEILLIPFIVLIGGLYALANPNNRLLVPMMRALPREGRDALYRILQLLGERLFGWIRGTVIAMTAVGLLSMLALYLIGVPYWLVLGTVVGLLEFIPIFGPWIGGIPAVLIAFLDAPIKGLWAAIAIIAIQQIESYLITPWAMSQAAKIHPLITLFALILFGSIFGILGILLALPIVILIWTVVEVLWVERTLGTARDPLPPVVEE